MNLALDALNLVTDLTNHDDELYEAIEALRTAIEQANKREWVGLTNEERKDIFKSCGVEDRGYVAAMVEAKLKDKNI